MSEKQWPKCQAEGSETIIAWDDDVVGSREWEPFYGHLSSGEETVTQYTRTDIAEARIATLEAERDALQARIAQLEESAIGGYEDGWHALRNERDALRARIDGAPRGRVAISDNFVQPLDVLPRASLDRLAGHGHLSKERLPYL